MNKRSQSGQKPPGGPSGERGALRREAYEKIEDLLNSGSLSPGDVISQRELVKRTGATLGSVREAVPRFEAEGLLVALPQRGLMVPGLDVTFVRDAYQMRQIIEVAAVPYMIANIEKDAISEWIGWHETASRELDNEETVDRDELLHRLQRYDWAMHSQFVEAMGNKLIANAYRVTAIKTRMAVQNLIKVTPQNAKRIIREHLAILRPLLADDAEGTTEALTRHIRNSLRIALGGSD